MHPLRVSGGVGDAAGSRGWGAAEVGAKPPVGTEPWGQPAPCLGAAQPWRSRAVQPIGARQYLSLGGNKNCPVGLIQKATTTLSPQNLLSVVSYLLSDQLLEICSGKTVLSFPALVGRVSAAG